MAETIERHGGTVEKFIGDAVMAVFGIPTTHEDDALRAVRAAAGMQDALRLLNKELERDQGAALTCRIGVHTGEVVAGDATLRQAMVTGDAVNVAARLEQGAPPGEILISDATLRLVRDAVVVEKVDPLEAKGKTEPVPAHRLVGVHEGAAGVARRLDSPMVGRERPLDQLTRAFDEIEADRVCHLFTVLGSAGVGKSRLSPGGDRPDRRSGDRPARAVHLLRRGHHVSAADGDRPRCPRPGRPGAARSELRDRDDAVAGSGRGGHRGPRRPARRDDLGCLDPGGGDRVGDPPVLRGARVRTTAARRRGRSSLGRARTARPARPRGGSQSRCADPAGVHGATRAAGPARGLGRRQASRDHRGARATVGARIGVADRQPPRNRRAGHGRAGADPRRGRGEPAVRRGNDRDARR